MEEAAPPDRFRGGRRATGCAASLRDPAAGSSLGFPKIEVYLQHRHHHHHHHHHHLSGCLPDTEHQGNGAAHFSPTAAHLPARRETQKPPAKRELKPQEPPPQPSRRAVAPSLASPGSYLFAIWVARLWGRANERRALVPGLVTPRPAALPAPQAGEPGMNSGEATHFPSGLRGGGGGGGGERPRWQSAAFQPNYYHAGGHMDW